MRTFRSFYSVSVLFALLLGARAEAAVTLPGVPKLVARDLTRSFPVTAVGQTSTLTCFGLCFRQATSPDGSCDGSGTENLDKNVALPFFARNFRRGSASGCGGSPVTLPVSIGPGEALWFDAGFSPTQPGSFSDTLRISGFNFFFSGSTGTVSPCTPSATTLCVGGGNRFAVTAAWRTTDGQSGAGHAVSLTADTGYFWFFSESNVEMVLKVLDACSFNQRFWVFAGGLTNVQVDITVLDTATGAVKIYHNPQGASFQPVQDTSAFSGCPGQAATPHSTGTPTGTTLAVDHGRFRVTTTWSANGQSGAGQAVQLTDETGYFWFFSPSNVEMVIKVLDACSLNQSFWVFAGGLTNVQVDITVLDTATQTVKTYHNPQGTPFQPIQDTGAFSTCSPGGLPPDPGEAGKQTLAGVDSDHDGIRDDLQRYIALTYSSSPVTMDALRQTTKVVQGVVLDSASTNSSINHATDLARALECLEAIRPADAATVHETLISQALNTEARGLAFLASNDRLGGTVFPLASVNGRAASCDAVTASDLFLLGRSVIREKDQSCVQGQRATVFFGNGVWNTCEAAQVSTNALAGALQGLLTADERSSVSFALACNPTRGYFADAWRATRQYFQGNFTAFYGAMVGVLEIPDPLLQVLLSGALVINAGSVVDAPTLNAHVGDYQSLLLEGQKVIVVSHSQGNFYANSAAAQLTSDQRRSFGIVAVATPSDHVEGNWPFTTLKNDRVITPIPGALHWNVDNGAQTAHDLSGHQFVVSYLAPGSTSRSRILSQVVDELHTLSTPTNPAGEGIITATLTWSGATDVDLHVSEPDGTHVYYQNLQGDSGFLDRDNITGFGPEHYFVSCSTVQTGTYHVGVNYYRGEFPETAHIQVSAGLVSRSFDITLPLALGFSGNNSPQPIADIVVGGSAATGYTFTVQPRF
jgi:hypothetical protein